MIHFKRRNTIWLFALSVLMALVLISGNIAADVQALLLGVFVLALVGTFVDISALTDRTQLVQAIQQRSPLNRSSTRMSPQAKEAVDRAASRGGYREADLQLVDIGMIASQSGQEGMSMRRTRSISKDDDGVRPFVTLLVTAENADRRAVIRYEVVDHHGKEQYIHEMRVFLRDGEMNILSDHHLPLRGNDKIAGMGDWDLRVFVDNTLIGIHNFTLTPSGEERRQRLRGGNQYFVTGDSASDERRDARRLYEADDEDEEIPLSLEELLKNQNSRSG